MTITETSTTPEKHISKSNTWKTRKSKIKKFGYPIALSSVLLLSSCGSNDSNLTKLSKEHDDAVENVTTQKDELKTAQEKLAKAQEKVQKEQQDVINAQQKEAELRTQLQQAKVNPSKE